MFYGKKDIIEKTVQKLIFTLTNQVTESYTAFSSVVFCISTYLYQSEPILPTQMCTGFFSFHIGSTGYDIIKALPTNHM